MMPDHRLSLATAVAELSLNNGITVVGSVDAIDDNKNLIELKIPKEVPMLMPIIPYYKPETYKRAKHRSTKKIKTRKNKAQAKSRRANRK